MEINHIITEIDAEIARLQQAKDLLNGTTTKRSPGRPAAHIASGPTKRTMSAAGRARIAAAQKARWAKVKKAAK
jgi:hypothetical protein